MKLKKLFIVSLSLCMLSGCANQITYQTITELSKDSDANQKAYAMIHDSIERLNELDSYTYTLSTLSYDPTSYEPMCIETSKYKIKNEENGYSGVGLIRTEISDLALKDRTTKSVNTYSFENSNSKQKMRDELTNGYACEIECTRTINVDNPGHRYLISPKENLYDSLLGEKVGFLKNILEAQYAESTELKEIHKTKKNYLKSFIDSKINTWKDTVIAKEENQTIIEYNVNIELGMEYLEMILSRVEDEEIREILEEQINGERAYIETISRHDVITIDPNGYLSSRIQKYTILDSKDHESTLEFDDFVDISKVTNFSFSYSETNMDEYMDLLSGSYSLQNADGSIRTLIFSYTSAFLEENGETKECSYTLKNGILKLNILDENGTVLKTERYTLAPDYSYLMDMFGNYYVYFIPEEYVEEVVEEVVEPELEEIEDIETEIEEDEEN